MKTALLKISMAALTAMLMLTSLATIGYSQSSSAVDSQWQILVDGEVQNPLNLTLADLWAMPRTTVEAELACYGYPLANGQWTGVKLGTILEAAGVLNPDAPVNFIASDGYTVQGFSMQDAMREDVIIAYELNGQPLAETIRLVVPNANGNVWIRQITEIVIGTPSFTTPTGNSVTPPVPPWDTLPKLDPPSKDAPASNSSNDTVTQQPANQTVTQIPETEPTQTTELPAASDSPKPMEYSYVLAAAVLAAMGCAAAILLVKRRKTHHT